MPWLSIGLWLCAAAIVAGAFGAHGLADRLDAKGLELWETAARYLMYGGLGLALLGLVSRGVDDGRDYTWAAATLLTGTLIFSGTVALLALGGPRWLGAVTPIGGVLLILGFVVFGFQALHA